MPSSSQYTPQQKIYIDPFDGKLFDFDTTSSKLYLAQSINNLLRAYGNNFIIEGFGIKNLELDINLNLHQYIVHLQISSGRAIIDNTYIEILENTYLTFDVSDLLDTGFLVLSINYNYLHTPYVNRTKLQLNYFNELGNSNSNFFTETNRIIINKITFNKLNDKISKTNIDLFNKKFITLNNIRYEIYPRSVLLNDFIRVLHNAF